MAKITAVIPEPTPEYTEDNQRQLRESLDTMKNELNFGYQDDLRKEVERFAWFNTRFGC